MRKLWADVNAFCHAVTLSNWGLPWHLFLAGLAMTAGTAGLLAFGFNPADAMFYAFMGANALGAATEAVQWRGSKDRRDMFQDLTANFMGSLLQYMILAWGLL